jgi:hypothetical protein
MIERIWDANPQLDLARDAQAVERLAFVYDMTAALHRRMRALTNAPLTNARANAKQRETFDVDETEQVVYIVDVSRVMDELHRLYADALRLEIELGITAGARRKQGTKDGETDDDGELIKGAKPKRAKSSNDTGNDLGVA